MKLNLTPADLESIEPLVESYPYQAVPSLPCPAAQEADRGAASRDRRHARASGRGDDRAGRARDQGRGGRPRARVGHALLRRAHGSHRTRAADRRPGASGNDRSRRRCAANARRASHQRASRRRGYRAADGARSERVPADGRARDLHHEAAQGAASRRSRSRHHPGVSSGGRAGAPGDHARRRIAATRAAFISIRICPATAPTRSMSSGRGSACHRRWRT